MLKTTLPFLCLALMSLAAYADVEFDKSDTGKGGSKTFPVKEVSFDEFQERCRNPEGFSDVQIRPQNIVIKCTDIHREWVSDAPGEVPLMGNRTITTSVTSHKWTLKDNTLPVDVASKPGACFRFKEIESTLVIERSLSCDDVLNLKGGADSLCFMLSEEGKKNSSKLIEVKETGRKIDPCPSSEVGKGKGQGK